VDEDYYRKCKKCGQIESIYKKILIRPTNQILPNKFYICDNPNCIYHIEIPTQIQLFTVVDNDKFKWIKIFGSGITQMI
jgi:hypothetical protein